jgi:hypothetical protein
MLLRWWFGRNRKVRCPECFRKGFREWNQVTATFKRGGRWCPHCGYGVHPPPELVLEGVH